MLSALFLFVKVVTDQQNNLRKPKNIGSPNSNPPNKYRNTKITDICCDEHIRLEIATYTVSIRQRNYALRLGCCVVPNVRAVATPSRSDMRSSK